VQAGRSLPPVDAVFQFGGPAIQAWLAANNWQLDWGYNDNFAAADIVEHYERQYQEQCPLYRDDIPVVLGGWCTDPVWPVGFNSL